ncbi:prephenate dehydrogenase [Virgibacillus sp. C22-A2]|uniref:Prephenate dehydrogenase n=1 Tax=Virgibacillus tibetensis TaxID=3042313 RepID=A0ABU6KBF6_9BACI|nr:prephenate dehydrogenase [Virgibacillus sp. C22-A2]
MKHNVVVAGLGLIGGSLAKAIVQFNQVHVVGYDVNKDTMDFAVMNGIVHESNPDFKQAVQTADVVILAVPISETIRLMKIMDNLPLSHDVVVTDVASVKSSILEVANSLDNKHISFIGGHPMAGSHKKGIQAAKAHLFENAIYVLTPSINSTNEKLELLKYILEPTKSKFVLLNADEHDEMTAVVSHFPHLIASSLVHQANKWSDTHAFLPKLAAGGFQDITRIASSNPAMWQDIFFHNQTKMSQLLEEWIHEMQTLKHLVDSNDKKRMVAFLQNAKTYRDGLGKTDKGAIPSFYDLYVDIRDQTGAIASVAQLLANEEISITNIQILEIRDGITGVLRVSLATEEAQMRSYELLLENKYEIMTI